MSQIEYDIILVINLGKALPDLDELQRQLNNNLAKVGVDERIGFNSRMRVGVITMTREHTEGELNQMKAIILAETVTSSLSFAKSVEAVELIRRKPGHVSLSAS